MKRLFTLLFAALLIATGAWAQKRLVLIEEFTNTGCGPCASWSPVLDSCINYRLGDCIAIKYHSGFPNHSDEFYLYDQEAHQAKVDFYHITGVPTTLVDGQELADRSFEHLHQAISYCMQQPVNYDLKVSKELQIPIEVEIGGTETDNPKLLVQAELTPLVDDILPTSNVRLFVAAIEEHIVAAAPYPNGEEELYYTMRKMITPPTGQTVSAAEMPLSVGQTYTYEGRWEVDFFDDLSQMGVVAYLQDMDTKEILATAYAGPNAEGENRVALQNLYDTPDLICTPNYYGKVIFRNDGANTITSATLNVRINNIEKHYPWTGSLDYLERDTMAFDGFTDFELVEEGKNEVWVWLSNINGSEAESNMRIKSFDNAVQVSHAARLKIYTDKKPEEITWKLYNSAGDVMAAGGPYEGQARKFITIDFDLTFDDCYSIEFLDAGGDGIKGASGNGYYQLFQVDESGKASRVAQGDYDGASYILNFSLKDSPAPPHRLVLFEEFTNTSCDPCADFSPSLDKVIFERMGDMVPITYHWNFPSAQDPFYLANTEDVLTRADFYGITGVPSLWVDGQHAGAYGYEEYLDAYIDYSARIAARVDIHTDATLTDGELTAHVILSNLNSLSSNLRLFVAAVEERIEWDKPAANGERSWNYVMRKLLPTADGQTVDATQVTPQEFTFNWTVSGYTDLTELGLVTFVQDMDTKQIIGTVYTPRPTGYAQAAKIIRVIDMPDRICTPEFSSVLMVRNTGSETLTSATLNVSINGSVQQTQWAGSLEPLAITNMHIPTFTDFALSDDKTNEVELWLSNLNDNSEAESVHKHFSLANAVAAANSVRLTVMTDQNPEEITWKVYNSAGDVVCEGGPYTETHKKQVITLPLDTDDCYLLEFADSGNDGIKEGRGYYILHEVSAEGRARLLVQDTYDTGLHDVFFSLHNAQATGIQPVKYVALPTQHTEQPAYDLQGRKATSRSHIIITNDRKIITK